MRRRGFLKGALALGVTPLAAKLALEAPGVIAIGEEVVDVECVTATAVEARNAQYLATIAPQVLAALDVVSRELIGFIPRR